MTGATKYVALNMHQATTLASVRAETGRVIARTILPTEGPALVEFFRGVRGTVQVAFEEGTQAQWLHDLLVPLVHQVVVCDRHGERRCGNKGDRVDADQLSARLWRGELRAVYHGSTDRATLKELTRDYRNLVEDATRVMLRLKALFRARAIPAHGTRVYQARERASWLATLPERGVRFRAETLYAELDVLRAAPAGQGRHAHRGAAGSGLAGIAGDSVSGPGAGGAAARHHADALALSHQAAAVGLRRLGSRDPLERRPRAAARPAGAPAAGPPDSRPQSESQPGAARRLQGRGHGAHRAAGPAPSMYQRMRARGLREELARVTLTRKLAALTLRLWKRGERYDPTRLTQQAH